MDKKNIYFGENEFQEQVCQVDNSVTFSGKSMGSEEFFNQMIETFIE